MSRSNTENGEILSAAGLGRRLGERWLWRRLDVHLRASENLAIVGPTGIGKSLLMRCLAGLDPLDEGTIAAGGRPFDDWDPSAYRARVVYLHQRPALWEGSVEDNLRAVFRLVQHAGRRYDRRRIVDWLTAFERGEHFLAKEARDLSGGEAQIVALMRALSIDPAVLLLDEPSASMDAVATARVETIVRRWVGAAPDRAAIWTTHDAEQVGRVADRSLVLGAPAADAHD